MRLLVTIALVAFAAAPAVAQDKENPLIAKLKGYKDLKGPFTLVVSLSIKKGEEKTFLDAYDTCAAATRKEKGCIAYDLQQDLDDPTKFILYERWKSVAALEEHLGFDHTKKLLGTFGKVVAAPPTLALYKMTDGK
jgi:quinol monooxygenase YgiN